MKHSAQPIQSEQLSRFEMLDKLSSNDAQELLRTSLVNTLSQGTLIFDQSKRDKQLFFILEGQVELLCAPEGSKVIKAGSIEARRPLAAHLPGQLEARAFTKCRILSFDADMLDLFLNWSSPDSYQVNEMETEIDHDWANHLLSSRALQRLSDKDLEILLQRIETQQVGAGQVVIRQDDTDDKYFIIKEGRCTVSRKPSPEATEIKLAELKEGDAFGEEALLSGAPRSATVTMTEPGTLMSLTKQDFSELLADPFLNAVDYDACKEMQLAGTVLLDIRSPEEYDRSHLADSINIPLALLRLKIKHLDNHRKYVALCDDGSRASVAGFLLNRQGFDCYILDGGLNSVPADQLLEPAATAPAEVEVEREEAKVDTNAEDNDKIKIDSLADHWGDAVAEDAGDERALFNAPSKQCAEEKTKATVQPTTKNKTMRETPHSQPQEKKRTPRKERELPFTAVQKAKPVAQESAKPRRALVFGLVLVGLMAASEVTPYKISEMISNTVGGLLAGDHVAAPQLIRPTAAPAATPAATAPMTTAPVAEAPAKEAPAAKSNTLTPEEMAAALALPTKPAAPIKQEPKKPVAQATTEDNFMMDSAPVIRSAPAARSTGEPSIDPATRGLKE